MKLNNFIKINYKKKKKLGRGIGSTKGKTAGRGHKGQKSRSGVAIKSFEGGQMPLYRRLPKRGFNSFNKKYSLAILNLSKIQNFIDKKKINNSDLINLAYLIKLDAVNKKYKKIKVLGSGILKDKVNLEVDFISKSAKSKIEKLGGKIKLNNTSIN